MYVLPDTKPHEQVFDLDEAAKKCPVSVVSKRKTYLTVMRWYCCYWLCDSDETPGANKYSQNTKSQADSSAIGQGAVAARLIAVAHTV